jgi:hypothetical protein
MLTILENNMAGTPLGDNLIQLARRGNSAGIEQIVRNLAQEKGINYDTEFPLFKSRLGLN